MSRSTHRALLTAPLLLGALLLSSCGGDDETPVATSPPVAATTAPAGAVATSPTTPAATTPDASTPESADEKKAGDEAPAVAPPAAGAPAAGAGAGAGAPSGGVTATTAKPPTQAPTKSADDTQNKVLGVLAAVETCFAGEQTYEKCDSPGSLTMFGAKVVNSKRPGKNQVAVTNSSRETLKIIGTDAQGVRWILTKSSSGDVKRKCKLASGQVCNPATW